MKEKKISVQSPLLLQIIIVKVPPYWLPEWIYTLPSLQQHYEKIPSEYTNIV